jgi:predicted membrane protein
MMGETNLDLRGAVLEGPHAAITSFTMMGETKVIVPKGVEVDVTGFVLMGSRKVKVEDAPIRPGTPTVHIRCIGMMGEVRVESR